MKIFRVCILIFIFITTSLVSLTFAMGPSRGLSTLERLGRHLYKDKNFSFNGTQSCQVCHHPLAGFADRRNALNPYVNFVSIGADGVSKGDRNAPTSAYAGYSPPLQLSEGKWIGGLFWDGRADGSVLGDPLAEQAQGPPLNPIEMAMPDIASIIDVIQSATYANLFTRLFGPNAFDDHDAAYDNFARAIAAYERSSEITRFSSKFDTQREQFTDAENRGANLFSANCAACHSMTATYGAPGPLFTNYGYYNVGIPSHPLIPRNEPDLGLGNTVADSNQDGKFKVPTLRNIAMSAPYAHNGIFPTLREMVEFMNDNGFYTPEVDRNIETSVGNLGLNASDIADIIAFLMTLTDQ